MGLESPEVRCLVSLDVAFVNRYGPGSAVWIRAQTNPDFIPNYPPAERSCLLLNSRFLLMFGGCLLDANTHKPCMSYSPGPVNYDISLLRPVDYAYHAVGYLVPESVSKVIGGK